MGQHLKMTDNASNEEGEAIATTPVGHQLRAAREASGQTIEQVAKALALRTDQVTALEDSAWASLPSATFTAGFIRSYANHFGLDAKALSDQYRHDVNAGEKGPDLVFPEPEQENQVSTSLLLGAALGLALLIYGSWMVFSGDASLISNDDSPPVIENSDAADQASSAATNEIDLPAQPEPQIAEPIDQPVLTDQDDDAIEDMGMRVAAPVDPTPAVTPVIQTDQDSSEGTADDAIAADYDGTRIILRATSDSWMQVKDNDGTILLTRVMTAGDSFPVPSRRDLRLLTGNAGGTVIEVDGSPLPSLGGEGVVVRNIKLDPDQLKQGIYY